MLASAVCFLDKSYCIPLAPKFAVVIVSDLPYDCAVMANMAKGAFACSRKDVDCDIGGERRQ